MKLLSVVLMSLVGNLRWIFTLLHLSEIMLKYIAAKVITFLPANAHNSWGWSTNFGKKGISSFHLFVHNLFSSFIFHCLKTLSRDCNANN